MPSCVSSRAPPMAGIVAAFPPHGQTPEAVLAHFHVCCLSVEELFVCIPGPHVGCPWDRAGFCDPQKLLNQHNRQTRRYTHRDTHIETHTQTQTHTTHTMHTQTRTQTHPLCRETAGMITTLTCNPNTHTETYSPTCTPYPDPARKLMSTYTHKPDAVVVATALPMASVW